MLRFFLSLLFVVALVAPALAADTYVRPHVRKDGTYVQPHMRSAPDSTPNNNWSTVPNVNPTGRCVSWPSTPVCARVSCLA
jgi:hypothetical protein